MLSRSVCKVTHLPRCPSPAAKLAPEHVSRVTSLLKVVDEASEEAKTACGGLEEGSSAATAAAADALLNNSSGSGSGGSSSSSAYGAVKQLLGLCEGSPDYVTGLGTETATIQSVLRLLRWTACGDAQAPPALHTIAATCLGILVWAHRHAHMQFADLANYHADCVKFCQGEPNCHDQQAHGRATSTSEGPAVTGTQPCQDQTASCNPPPSSSHGIGVYCHACLPPPPLPLPEARQRL